MLHLILIKLKLKVNLLIIHGENHLDLILNLIKVHI